MVSITLLQALLIGLPLTVSSVGWKFADIRACNRTSLELANLAQDENVDPCILYDLGPNSEDTNVAFDLVVQNVQVTPSNCPGHRDGSPIAIKRLNGDNDGRGFAIGFNKDFYVGSRLISVVAGNPVYLGQEAYLEIHTQILDSFLVDTSGQFRYILGSCSCSSDHEKPIAEKHEVILMAQVGPPVFYKPENSNPWVFGIHLSSDDYPLAAARKLAFKAAQDKTLDKQPVRLVYRTKSDFFRSTCHSALSVLQEAGFKDIGQVYFNPDADEDGDGRVNAQDEDFLHGVADTICPSTSVGVTDLRPAVFMCTLREQDVIIPRLRENGCVMPSFWVTSATWEWWTGPIQDSLKDYQGGGQWHSEMTYSDRYFKTGQQMLGQNEAIVGYVGGYDTVVSYVMPVLNVQHLEQAYRVFDEPRPKEDIVNSEGRELLRRRMLDVKAETLVGPVFFNGDQRNVGRGAAGVQWQNDPVSEFGLKSALVSPDNQAESEVVIPSEIASDCAAGEFHNVSILLQRNALLQSVCELCPENTYTSLAGTILECEPCPLGTSTDGLIGASSCTNYDDNLLSKGMLAFGYIALGISWAMALIFFAWIIVFREDPVVRLAQIPYLVLICFGGIVSSSAILGITFQAGSWEDTDTASSWCKAVPILYSIGWVIQYGSLCAKTLRLKWVVEKNNALRKTTITTWSTFHVILIPLVVDIFILTTWTFVDPLEYGREEISRNVENGVLTIESIGRCKQPDGSVTIWAFIGPLFANHIILVLWTHCLLYQVRDVNNRYQENKYLGMAAIFALEVAVVGAPILLAAQDSVEATFVVITGIVAFDNIGVLSFIFIPKITFQRKGLEEGVTLNESILSTTHKLAKLRESGRKYDSGTHVGYSNSNSSGNLPIIAESEREQEFSEDEEECFHLLRRHSL